MSEHITPSGLAAILEDLHHATSDHITTLEATLPPRLEAADTEIRQWAADALTALHTLVARINGHRTTIQVAQAAAAVPPPTAAPEPTPADTEAME